MTMINITMTEAEYLEILDTRKSMRTFKELIKSLSQTRDDYERMRSHYETYSKLKDELDQITNTDKRIVDLENDLKRVREYYAEDKKSLESLRIDFKDQNRQLMRTMEERDELKDTLSIEYGKRHYTRWQHLKIALGWIER